MTNKKNPPAVTKTSPREIPDQGEQAKIAQEVLGEFLDGGSIAESAARRGMPVRRVYAMLVRHAARDFKDAKAAQTLETYEAAEKDLANAGSDHAKIGIAREKIKSCQWLLEREFSATYGKQAPAQPVAPVIIQIANLRGEPSDPPMILTLPASSMAQEPDNGEQ